MALSRNALTFLTATAVLIGFVVVYDKPVATLGKSGTRVRVAYMPNLTHAPAVYGFEKGSFQAELKGLDVQGVTFNAGPEEMEAIRAGAIDLAFVGPGPVVQSLSKGDQGSIVLLNGSCEGGAALVCRPDLDIHSIADLGGHTVAVPQLGGSQDISLRHFLADAGMAPVEKGGTVQIVPVKNADLPLLFAHGQVDAAWVPEPWSSILRVQHGARLVVDERDLWPNHKFPTTLLVARKGFMRDHPDIVRKFQLAHRDAIDALNADRKHGMAIVGDGLARLTGKRLPDATISPAWDTLSFSTDILTPCLVASAQTQLENGYLKKMPSYGGFLAIRSDGAGGR